MARSVRGLGRWMWKPGAGAGVEAGCVTVDRMGAMADGPLDRLSQIPGTPWFRRLRLRVLGMVAAVAIVAWGVIAFASWPVLPVVGLAVAGLTLAVNYMTSRLGGVTCYGCGADLSHEPAGEHGVTCPGCGAISRTYEARLTLVEPDSGPAEDDEEEDA